MIHEFNRSIIPGYIGCETLVQHFQQDPELCALFRWDSVTSYIENVEEDFSYQRKDIDLVFHLPSRKLLIEVKADRYPRNIFFETVSNKEHSVPGWVYKTGADVVLYYFLHMGVFFALPFPETRQWIDFNHTQLLPYKKTVLNRTKKNGISTSEGYAIPMDLAAKQIQQFSKKRVKKYPCKKWGKQELEDAIISWRK